MIIKPAKAFSTIERLKLAVLASTLLFAFFSSTKNSTWQFFASLFTTSSLHSLWKDLLFSPLSMLTLNYTDLNLQMLFDFLILNAFITPLASFVFSFLGKRNFIFYILGATLLSSYTLHAFSLLFHTSFLTTTLFSSVILSLITLWALVHAKNTPTVVMFLPMRPSTILAISIVIACYSSFTSSDWISILSLSCSLLYAYFISVFCIRLKSGSTTMERIEEALIDVSIWCEKLTWRFKSLWK